jgi:hypothetical protein
MVVSWRRRLFLVALGVAAYVIFLHISYGLLQHSYIPPPWWREHIHVRRAASISWFVLINLLGAVTAALPVALGAVFLSTEPKKLALVLLVGLISSLYFIGEGIAAYGFPIYTAAWIIDVLQFLSISLAVLLEVILFWRRPLTNVGRGRYE